MGQSGANTDYSILIPAAIRNSGSRDQKVSVEAAAKGCSVKSPVHGPHGPAALSPNGGRGRSAPPPSPGRPGRDGSAGRVGMGAGGSREPRARSRAPVQPGGSHAARPTFGLTSARARHGRRRCRGDGPRYRDSGSAQPGRLSPGGEGRERHMNRKAGCVLSV